jgi:Zn-dependent peptidase ImmA (M78 family)
MTRLSRETVETRAWELVEANGVVRPPVDVERLAQQLGYDVIFERFEGDVSGMLMREPAKQVTIGVNTFHAKVRQRFSIAHELGHAQLHLQGRLFVDPPTREFFRDDNSTSGDDPQEVQANQFAAALLMPRPFIADVGRRIIKDQPDITIDGLVDLLAKKFVVSTQAMRYRLVNLGIVEPE